MVALGRISWVIESAPRVLVHLASLAALGAALGACVPTARHEEVLSAAQVEHDGHRRTLARLYAVEQKLALAEAALRDRERHLGDREQLVEEARLESSLLAKERDTASDLVEQLRGELARVGDHMQSFASERNDLASQLESARERTARLSATAERLNEVGRIVRDLTLLLGDTVAVGEVELEVVDGKPVVRVDANRVWAGEGDELVAEGKKIIETMARLASLHPRIRYELTEQGAGGEASIRLRRLVDALVAQGVAADRALIRVDEASKSAAARAPTNEAPSADPKLEVVVEIAAR
jgi:hypothetical protein